MLKPFLPQLQTTFLKALNDTNRTVRLKAGFALSHLITIHTRPDPLYNELHGGIKNSEDCGVRDTYLQAMRGCVATSGDKLSPPIRRTVTTTLLFLITTGEDSTRSTAAGCLGALLPWLPEEELQPILSETILQDNTGMEWTVRHGRSAVLQVVLANSPNTVHKQDMMLRTVLSHLAADRVPIVSNGVRSAGYMLAHCLKSGDSIPAEILTPLVKTMNHPSNDVKVIHHWFLIS